jgi:hypothetical protein
VCPAITTGLGALLQAADFAVVLSYIQVNLVRPSFTAFWLCFDERNVNPFHPVSVPLPHQKKREKRVKKEK